MTIYKGSIVTCDEKNSIYHYLVEEKGVITGLYDTLPQEYDGAEVLDYQDKAILPSFGDTHMHFSSWALFAATLDVRHVGTFSELSDLINDFRKANNPKVILGFGTSAHTVKENRLPDKTDLDRMVSDRPLMLVKYDGHACSVNSKLLQMFPKKLKILRGFNEETGIFTQEAFFFATDWMTSKVSVISLLRYMLEGVDRLAEQGVSMVHTTEGVGFPLDLDVDLVRFLVRGLNKSTLFRIYFQTMDVKKVVKRKLLRIGGCFKTALDGCFGSQDAALLKPYSNDSNNSGILYYTDDEVFQFLKEANRKELQIQLHTIGDAAFSQAISAFEKALSDYPRENHRHSIIHACLLSDEDMEACARLGIIIAAQPSFLHWPQEPLPYLENLLGNRVKEISPFRKMLDAGIHISGGSDAPCTLPDPLHGIYSACNHYRSDQSVSIPEALRMFTYEAAYAGFDEQQCGTLEVGKLADIVVLNKNPLSLKPEELLELRVEELFLSGKPYQKGQGLLSLLLTCL